METYFPWIIAGVSGAGLYTEHLVADLRQRWEQATQSGQAVAPSFPGEFLSVFAERMASKKLHLWALFVSGLCWGIIDLI